MGQRILVAEDNNEARQLLELALSKAGYSVVGVSDGAQALLAYGQSLRDENPFKLLLLDCAMPNMTGTHVASRVRELGDPLPILFFTAHLKNLMADDIQRYDIADVFEKPVDIESLTSRLSELLLQASGETPKEH